jgi:C4-dicarboxylate-binding protein DctP
MAKNRTPPRRHAITKLALCVLCVALATVAGQSFADPIVIRFAHVVGENTPKGIGAERFKQRVEEQLGDKVRVEVYPNSQRFTDEQVLTALLFGDVELAAPSLAKFRSFSKRIQVFDLPFLFKDVEAVHRFQASETGQALLDSMLPQGIKGLSYWDNGMRIMSANKPLRTPADAYGLTFRIEPSRVIETQFQMLGATTLRLPFQKVYDALAIGLVDGQENSWSNIASKQFYQVQKAFTVTNHSFQGYMVVTSAKFWDSLPGDVRETLEAILQEVTVEVNTIALEKAQSGRETVEASSSQVLDLTEDEQRAWHQALEPVRVQFEGQIGKDTIEAALTANQN